MSKGNAKKKLRKAVASVMAASLATTYFIPSMSLMRVMAAESENVGTINEEMIGELKATFSTAGGCSVDTKINFTKDGETLTLLELNDELLLRALKHGCKLPLNVSIAGNLVAGSNPGAVTIKINVGMGADDDSAAESLELGEYSVSKVLTEEGNFNLDLSQDIPSDTKFIILQIVAEYEEGVNSTVYVNSVSSVISDIQKPEAPTVSYDKSWTNKPFDIVVKATDTVGVEGIYDETDNRVTSDENPDEFTFQFDPKGPNTFTFYSKDYAKFDSDGKLTFTIDNYDDVAPENFDVTASTTEWTNTPPTITMSVPVKDASGSPTSYYYSIDGKNTFVPVPDNGDTFVINTEGEVEVFVKAADLATNETNANNSVIVKYDATAPVVSDLTSSSVGTKTVVTFGVNDSVSGVAHVYYVLGNVGEEYFTNPSNELNELTATEGKYSFETAEATPFTICVVDNANNLAVESGDLKIKPVISDIEGVTTTEDHSVDVDVVINDDSSIDSLNYEFEFDTNLIESIDKSINGNVVTLTINPVKNAFTDSTDVKIKVIDSDGLSDEKTFTVKIEEENDPPESSNQHSYTLGQNEKITFNPLTDDTATNKPDTDEDNETLRILEVSGLSNPNAGTLTKNDDGSLTFEAADGWYGNVTFSYTFTDDRIDNEEAPKSVVTITVDNTPDAPTAKADKVSTNEDTTVIIDVLANDTDPDLIPTGVLSGSTGDEFTIISVNGTPVTEGTTVDVSNGKVTLSSNKLSFEPKLNYNGTTTFEYKMKDSTGFESGAGVTVTVIPVNDPPVIEEYDKNQVYHIDEDSAIVVDGVKTPVPVFTFKVSDPDVTTTDDIMVSATSNTPSIIKSNTIGVAKNGSEFTISLLPVPNANGEVTITVKVSDGITPNTYTYKVVVDPINDPPVANNDDMTAKWKVHENKPFKIPVEDILLNDTDVDNDKLRVVDFELVTKNAGTIKDGVFTSNVNFEGPVTVKYTIADREEGATDVLTATGQFTFVVTPVDDEPVVKFIGTPESTVCDENCDNGNKLTLTFEVSDIDTEFKDLAFSIDTSNTTLINRFTEPENFVVTGPDDNGVYTVSFDAYPTAHKYGDCKITLHVTDSTTMTNCEVNVTVNPVQDAPVIFNRTYYAYEGQNIYVIPQSNGYDLDDEILTLVEINGQPLESGKPFVFNGATIDKFGSGFLFTAPPTIPEGGKVVLTYTVDDGSKTDTARATKNVTIYIEEAPTDVPSVSITTENPRFVRYDALDPYFDFKVSNGQAYDSSIYSFDPKVIEGVTLEELGKNEDGSINYRAHLDVADGIMAGKTVISVCAYSDSGYCSYAYCEVIVNDQNHIPTAEDFKVTTKEGSAYTFTTEDILAHAKDEDGDKLVVSSLELVSTTPERAYLKKNVDSEGNITYTYNPVEMNFFGNVTFKYTVSDKFDNSETKIITLTYENEEDLPIAYTDWYLLDNTDGATINIYTDKASAPEGKDYLLKDDYDHDNWYGANQPIYFVRFEEGEAGKYGTFKYDESTGVITYTRDGVCPNSHGRVEFYYYISNQDPKSPDFNPASCAKGTVVVYEDYQHISMGDAAWHSFKEDDNSDHTYEFSFSRGGNFKGNVTLDIEVTEGADLAEVKYDGSATTGSSFKYSVVPNLDANGEVHVKLILKAYDEKGEVFSTCSRTDVIYIVPVNDLPELTVTTEDPENEPNDNWVINEDEKKEFIVTYKDVETSGAELDFKVSVENVDPLKPVVYSSNIDLGEIEVTEVERYNGLVTRKVIMPTLPNMSGEVVLTFTVSDGSATSTFVSHGKVVPVDDLPTVNDIEMTINEDMPLTFDLHDYVMDIDTDISDVKFKLSDDSSVKGIVTIDEETGVVFFRPELNFYGDQEFKYQAGYYVTDPETGEKKWEGSEATVLVHITPVNDAPVIYDAPSYVVGNEDTPLDIPFRCEDAEDEHHDLKFTYEILSDDKTILLPEKISISHDDETHKYILKAEPEKDKNGTVKIRVTVTDTGNSEDPDEAPLTDSVDIEIFFAPVNDLPDLTPDKYGYTEDNIILESILGDEKEYVFDVLTNDSDIETKDKNKLSLSVDGTTKLGGRVVVTSDGHSVRYIPPLNVNGEDEFEYTVIDPDGGISKTTVNVLITPVNTPPTPVLVEETIDEHESITINLLDVGITDVEVENKEIPLQKIQILDVKGKGEGGSPVYGTISLKDGVLKYTETAQISTFVEEVLTYTVTDGAKENNISTGTIIISIHPISEPPILKDPGNGDKTIADDSTVWTMYEDNENGSGVFNIDIDDEDTKLDSLMFSVELDENASSIIRQSGVSIEKTSTGKRIKLTPIENKNGEFDMSVFVSDGTTEITRKIHVKVIPVNDAPVITDRTKENEIPSTVEYETREEVTYTKVYSATDIEDKTLDLVFSASKPAHGEVVFGSFGEWKYTPEKDFYGDDTFVITVTDKGEGVSAPKTDTVTVTMHVLPVNDAPSADNVTFVVYESDSGNDTYTIDLASVDGINNGGVIKGSQTGPFISDPDISDVTNMPDSVTNDILKITSVTGDKDRISFSGTTITYKPVQYNNIPESFEYEITDSEGKSAKGTITIEFIPVNQKPNQGDDTLKATEDQDYVEYDILFNDNDPDTKDKFTKTPDTLKILSVTSGDTTITVDKDGNGSGELKTTHGYVKIEDGKFYYKPDLHYYSTDDTDADKFSYTMTDYTDGASYDGLVGNDEVPFNITVNIASVNENPTISKLPDGEVDEDEHYKVDGIVTDDTYRETPRGELAVTVLSSSNQILVPYDKDHKDNIIVSGPDADGNFSIEVIPAYHAIGKSTITVQVADKDGGKATTSFVVNVNKVDSVPEPQETTAETDENTPIYIDVLANDDYDLMFEGDSNLKIVENSLTWEDSFVEPAKVSIVDHEYTDTYYDEEGNPHTRTGTRTQILLVPDSTWTLPHGESKTYTFGYKVTDNSDKPDGYTGAGVLNVTITAVNDKPVITASYINDAEEFAKDGAINEDMEADIAGYVKTYDEVHPDPDKPGVPVYSFKVNDEETAKGKLEVAVTNIKQNPTIGTKLLDAEVYKVDDEGNWELRVVPMPDQNGNAIVTVTVTDEYGDKTSTDVTVVVNPRNDEPKGGNDSYTVVEDSQATDKENTFDVLVNDDIDIETNNEALSVSSVRTTANTHGTVMISDDGTKVIYVPDKDYCNLGLPEGLPTDYLDNDELVDSLVENGNVAEFYYTAKDEGGTKEFRVIVSVTPVNDAPEITVWPTKTLETTETEPFEVFKIVVKDIDSVLTKDSLGVTVDNSILIKLKESRLYDIKDYFQIKSFTDNHDDTYTYEIYLKPYKKYNGTAALTLVANDGKLDSNKEKVNLLVGIKNDMPEVLPDAFVFEEGKSNPLDVLKNDYDEDLETNKDDEKLFITEGSVKFTEDWMNKVGSLVVNSDRTMITYKPNPGYEDFNGILKFTYQVDDSMADKLTDLHLTPYHGVDITPVEGRNYCTIEITPANDSPVAGNYKNTAPEDKLMEDSTTGLTIDLIALGYDADLIDNEFGDTGIKINQHANAAANSEVISIKVNSVTGNFKEGKTFDLVTGVATTNVGSKISYSADGRSITYIPAPNFNGEDTFTYVITDKAGKTSTGSVTIVVTPEEDNPIAVDDKVTQAEAYEDMEPLTINVLANDVDIDADTVINLNKDALNSADELYIAGVKNEPSDEAAKTIVTANGGTVVIAEDGKSLTYEPAKDFFGIDSFIYVAKNNNSINNADEAVVTIDVKQVNDKPVAKNAVADAIDEGSTTTFDLNPYVTDIDRDGNDKGVGITNPADELKITLVSVNKEKTSEDYFKYASIKDGVVTFNPSKDFNGTLVYTYRVTDKEGAYDEKTLTFTVNPKYDNPTAVADTKSTDEEKEVVIDVLKNDSDIDSDKDLNLVLKELNTEGLKVIGLKFTNSVDEEASGEIYLENKGTAKISDNKVLFTPDKDFNGKVSFYYVVSNQDKNTATQLVTVDVKNLNDKPVAKNAVAPAIDEGSTATFDLNPYVTDIDRDGNDKGVGITNPADELKITLVSVNKEKTSEDYFKYATIKDGVVTFNPSKDFNGTLVYTYRVTDKEGAYDEKTLTITVNPKYDNPTAVADKDKTQEEVTKVIDVLKNDSDIDSDKDLNLDLNELNTEGLKVTGLLLTEDGEVKKEITTANGGTVTIAEDGKSVSYKPAKDFFGKDSFYYEVSNEDPTSKSVALVEIEVEEVNDKPVAKEATLTMDEDTVSKSIDLKDYVSDDDLTSNVPGEKLTIKIDKIEPSTSKTVDYKSFISLDDGVVTVKPVTNFNGQLVVTYTVTDHKNASATNTLTITVNPKYDNPTAVADKDKTQEEVTKVIDVLKNDSDIDSDKDLNLDLNELNTKGLKVTGLLLTEDGEVNKEITTANGGIVTIAEDGKSVSYKPAKDFFGKDSFYYEVSNEDPTSKSVALVEIEVEEVNDKPVAKNAVAPAIDEGSTITFDLNPYVTDIDRDGNDKGVGITNPADELKITLVSVNKEKTSEDYFKYASIKDGVVTFNPSKDFNGTLVYTYRVTDKEGAYDEKTLTFTVNPKYDNPTAVADKDKTQEEVTKVIDVLKNDSDIDSDKDLNLDLSELNTEGLKVTGLLLTEDGEVNKEITTANGGTVTIAEDGKSVSYKPAKDFFGKDSFYYEVSNEDPTSKSVALVEIEVEEVNDKPVAKAATLTMDEDTVSKSIDLKDYVSDDDLTSNVPGEKLTIEIDKIEPSTSKTVDYKSFISLDDGVVTVKPVTNFNGQLVVTYTVTDHKNASATNTLTITVNPKYDNPTAVADKDKTQEEVTKVIEVLKNDSDIDSDKDLNLDLSELNTKGLKITGLLLTEDDEVKKEITTANGGTVTIAEDGKSVSYKPAKDFFGKDSFYYEVSNEDPTSKSVALVEIEVEEVNDKPVAKAATLTMDEDTVSKSIDLKDYVSDDDLTSNVPGEKLTIKIDKVEPSTSPSVDYKSFISLDDGVVTVKPVTNFNGQLVVTYTVTDHKNASATNTLTITVNPKYDNPTAVDDKAVTEEEVTKVIEVLKNDSDIDSDKNLNLDLSELNTKGLKVTGLLLTEDGEVKSEITTANGGIVTIAEDGKSVSYKPADNYFGNDFFYYEVSNEDPTSKSVARVDIEVGSLNDPPVAKDYEVSYKEDEKDFYEFNLVDLKLIDDNDLGIDANEKLTVTIVEDQTSRPDWVSVDNTAGANKITFNPAEHAFGDYEIKYKVTDAYGLSDTATITVKIAEVNDKPVAKPATLTMDEDTVSKSIDLKDYVSDADVDSGVPGEKLTITIDKIEPTTSDTVDYKSFISLDDGVVTVKPVTNFNGQLVVTYTVTDHKNASATNTLTITVNPKYDNPTAVADKDKTQEEVTKVIDVLKNDSDIDSDKDLNLDLNELNTEGLKVTGLLLTEDGEVKKEITTANGGTVTIAEDGKSVSYKPAKDFFGKDSFYYEVSNEDPTSNSVALVEIEVEEVNDKPVAKAATLTMDEDTVSKSIDLKNYVSDDDLTSNVPGEKLTIKIDKIEPATSKTVDYKSFISLDDGVVTVKPVTNFNGQLVVTYTVTDHKNASATNTLTITVNPTEDDPVAAKDKATLDEDKSTVINVLENDEDVDSDEDLNLNEAARNDFDKLVVTGLKNTSTDSESSTIKTKNGGIVTIAEDGKSVSYKAADNFNGPDSFIYVITNSDGRTSEAEVEIYVNPVDDNPTATKDVVTSDVAYEDMPAMVIDVLANDDDIDSDTAINLDPAVNDIANLKITGVKNETSDTEKMTITTINGGEVVVANDGKTLTYKPALNFNGKDSFIYVIENEDGNKAEAVVEIDVDPREDDPEAVADVAKVDEDSNVVIEVLANDKDIDSVKEINLNEEAINDFDKLVVTGIKVDDSSDEEPKDITTMNGGKAVIAEDGKSITYTPAQNFNGPDSFVYVITNEDGNTSEAKVDIYVNPVMDNPTAVDDAVSSDIAYEDMDALTINVLDNDSDTDSDAAINLDPEINDLNKMKVVGLKNSADDEATTTLTTINGGIVVISNEGKTVDYTPAANFNGIDSFIYVIANEDGNKAEATITIDVKPEEDNPTAVADKVSLDEDSSLVINVLDNDSDIDSDKDINLNLDAINSGNLVITGVVDSEGNVANEITTANGGKVKVSEDGKTISYTPVANFNGPDSFIYQITNDDGNLAEAEVSVYVNPINDNPTAMPDEASIDEDGSIEIDVLANDSDIDSDEAINLDEEALNTKGLTVSGVMASENGEAATTIKTNNGGTVTVKDNKVTYEPATNYYGPDSFYYEVTNEDGSKSVELVSITVNPVNDAPVAKDYEVTYKEDEADYYEFNLVALGLIDDNDLVLDENEVLTVTIESADVRSPMWASVDNTAGSNTITFNPPENFYGDYVINYKVTDAYGEASDAKIIVHVLPVNDPPVAKDYEVTYKEDEKESYEFNLVELMLIDDVDLMLDDNESLTVTVETDGTTNPDWVSVTNESGANKIKFTPVENYNGTFVITYTVTDAYGESATAKITIVIEPVGDGPVANPDEATTLQDESVVIKPLENDTGIDSDELFVDPKGFDGLEEGAKVTVEKETGEVTYTPAPGFYGKDTFSYTVMDAEGNRAVSTITVTVIKADFSIKVETDKDTFDSVEAGYENAPESIEVTITNTGNKPVEILPPNWNNFTTTLEEPVVILPGETVSFEVKPIVGLKPGNYSGDFTIDTNQGITGSVNLNFVVTDILTLTSHVIGEGGTASYVGHKTINGDEVIDITFTPYDGYRIKEVMINGVSQGAVDRVTINGTDKSIVVTVEFEKIPTSTSSTTKTGEDKSKNNLAALGLLSVATALAALKKKFKKEEEE